MSGPFPTEFPGPLARFSAGFAAELSRQGYTSIPAKRQMQLMAHLSEWLENEGVVLSELCISRLDDFLVARGAGGYTNLLTVKALKPLLTYLRQMGVVPEPAAPRAPEGPLEEVLERYRLYLASERGLAMGTVRRHVDSVTPFLCDRLSPDGISLDAHRLTAKDVTEFAVSTCSSQDRGTAKWTVTALRSLLRYLHVEGLVRLPLAAAVPSVAGWQLSRLPKGLEPHELGKLLASCDRRTRIGCRDFAILVVLARLGLRAGEVAAGDAAGRFRLASRRSGHPRQGRPHREPASTRRCRHGRCQLPQAQSSR